MTLQEMVQLRSALVRHANGGSINGECYRCREREAVRDARCASCLGLKAKPIGRQLSTLCAVRIEMAGLGFAL